jgi:AraC-like DNA-binding protein
MTLCLNEFRVEVATQPLINTNQIILEIYFGVGFENYANFNRQFKRIKWLYSRPYAARSQRSSRRIAFPRKCTGLLE